MEVCFRARIVNLSVIALGGNFMLEGKVKWFNSEKVSDSSKLKDKTMYSFISLLFKAKASKLWKKANLYLSKSLKETADHKLLT